MKPFSVSDLLDKTFIWSIVIFLGNILLYLTFYFLNFDSYYISQLIIPIGVIYCSLSLLVYIKYLFKKFDLISIIFLLVILPIILMLGTLCTDNVSTYSLDGFSKFVIDTYVPVLLGGLGIVSIYILSITRFKKEKISERKSKINFLAMSVIGLIIISWTAVNFTVSSIDENRMIESVPTVPEI